MNKELQQLIKLAAVDKEIDAFGSREEQIKAEVNALTEKQKETAAAIAAAAEEVKEAHLNKAKNEILLKELSGKLKEIEKKMSQIKSEKELKALQIEEDLVREQISYTNEEIERFEKIEAAKNDKAAALADDAAAIEAKIADASGRIEGAMASLEAEKGVVYEKKNALSMEVSQKILSFYQKVRRWAGNSAVVPVRKQACMGCWMVVSDKVYGDVIRGDDIVTCPSCGRILFIEAGEEA